jgi:hypothetical protein
LVSLWFFVPAGCCAPCCPLSGVGRDARAGYAAFIFEGRSIFLQIANFPLEFTLKLNGVDFEVTVTGRLGLLCFS